MTKQRYIMWIALAAIVLLIEFSIIGAFYGADKAKLFFSSAPLSIYWLLLFLSLLASFFFKTLRQNPAQFILHLGIVLILGGSMWASEQGQLLRNRLFGTENTPEGFMLIAKGDTENYLTNKDFYQLFGRLPFGVKLKDFRIEYYPEEKNNITGRQAAIKNFCSDIAIIDNGKEILNKTIKVNKPLRYGGFHFYQNSYLPSQNRTILEAVPDNGLNAVYAGYWILGAAIFWQCWAVNIIKYIRKRRYGT